MPRKRNVYTRIILFSVIIITLLVSNSSELAAQCQACKSTVESNLAGGGTTGIGLNKGILYLLIMPYIMVMSIGGVWFFKFRKRSQQLENV